MGFKIFKKKNYLIDMCHDSTNLQWFYKYTVNMFYDGFRPHTLRSDWMSQIGDTMLKIW